MEYTKRDFEGLLCEWCGEPILKTDLVVSKVVNVACDESALTDGKPDAEKIAPITFDPVAHVYRPLAAPIAHAFKVGLE